MLTYGIYATTITVEGEEGLEAIDIAPSGARKSLDGTKWICHDPENAPNVEPLQTLTLEEARALMETDEWRGR